jgi:hypothetical protein
MSVYKEIYRRLDREKQVIAFCGKKRSGKDTAGEALKNMGYRTAAFADPIKTTCGEVFQFTDEQLRGSKKEEVDKFWEFSPRWAMQQVGTELFRDGIDPDVWVKSLLRRIDASDHEKWAVTDVRFPNEVRHLKKAGAELIYIRRPEVEPDLNPLKKKIAKQGGWIKKLASLFVEFGSEYHASEISLDDHPVSDTAEILNDGSEEQFRTAVKMYVSALERGEQKQRPFRASELEEVF